MFTQLTSSTKAYIFYGLAFGMTLIASLCSPLLGEMTMLVHMFGPTLATLFMLLVVTRDGYSSAAWRALGLHRGAGLSRWMLALFGPLLIVGIPYLVVWSSGVGQAALPAGYTFASLPLELLAMLGINTAFALGEEIGFRGYLLPQFTHLGTTRAMLLTGLMHGLWHFPLMWLTPLYPVLGSWFIIGPVVLLTLTFGGVFYGFLQLNTGSVWVTTLGHGAVNGYLAIFMLFNVTASPMIVEFLATEKGVLMLACTALTAGVIIYWMQRYRRPLIATQPVGA
jgi:uncharacterized protein